MTTRAKIQANRLNTQKSTGSKPRPDPPFRPHSRLPHALSFRPEPRRDEAEESIQTLSPPPRPPKYLQVNHRESSTQHPESSIVLPNHPSVPACHKITGRNAQNKPNFQNEKNNPTTLKTKTYANFPLRRTRKNKPKQTQSLLVVFCTSPDCKGGDNSPINHSQLTPYALNCPLRPDIL